MQKRYVIFEEDIDSNERSVADILLSSSENAVKRRAKKIKDGTYRCIIVAYEDHPENGLRQIYKSRK